MAEPRHHSIGEVLSMLKEEHADVTISKIRFFESQGLIDPERTPSGYRKFYDADIERLRWILVQQRDNFLPLKVIKSKLTAWEHGEESPISPEKGAPPEAYFATSGVSLSTAEIMRSSGLSADQLDAIVA